MKNRKSAEENSNANPSKDNDTDGMLGHNNPVPELSAAECATFEAISRSDQFTAKKAFEYFKSVRRPK